MLTKERPITGMVFTFDPSICAAARLRIYPFCKYLADTGKFRFKFCPLPGEYGDFLRLPWYHKGLVMLKRILQILLSKTYDVVILQRQLFPTGPDMMEDLLEAVNPPIVFDFDDAIFTLPVQFRPSNWNSDPVLVRELRKVPRVISMSSYVTAGNDYLKDYALRYNKRVEVIPNTIDTELFKPQPNKSYGRSSMRTVIGWLGTSSNLYYLKQIEPALQRLSRRYPILLKVVCSSEFSMDGVPVERVPWSESTEVKELANFDIGIVPLTDDEWTRGKCTIKLLKYMSMGIPTVASPVGFSCRVISDGENGLLASTQEEWYEKLSLLIEDDQLRHQFSINGRRTIEEEYSYDAVIPKFGQVLEKTCID